jgi:uncharacterized protein YggT (Ycf19 family)
MAVVHFILNGICLLLWLNWRSRRLGALPNRPPALALIGTLRRAGTSPRERWNSSIALVAVLLIRAIIYWQVGPGFRWLPQISMPGFVLHFRPDVFARMVIFSVLGFVIFLGAFYFSLLLICMVNRAAGESDYWNAFVRAHLGIFAKLPWAGCLLAPFVAGFLFWLAIGPCLAAIEVHQPVKSFTQLCGQATVVGLGSWLLWQYVVGAVLILHVLSSYVYLGNAPFWSFVGTTARNLVRPLSWLPLRLGKIDFTPLVALALLALAVWFAPESLEWLYRKLGA